MSEYFETSFGTLYISGYETEFKICFDVMIERNLVGTGYCYYFENNEFVHDEMNIGRDDLGRPEDAEDIRIWLNENKDLFFTKCLNDSHQSNIARLKENIKYYNAEIRNIENQLAWHVSRLRTI